jgi:hypothetical protein
MELVALMFLWPFLILAFALIFVAFSDLALGGFGWIFVALVIVLFFLMREKNRQKTPMSNMQQLETLRQIIITMSISLLIPIFVRYMFDAFDRSLAVILTGLVIGFGLAIWGMFIKSNKVLMYSNVIGGALSIVYVYFQLWELGGGPRVIAAAFGLIVAVVISVIKLKDKLT